MTDRQKYEFLFNVIIRSLDACLSKNYVVFDAHTSTNCCHGIATLTRKLILTINDFDLNDLREKFTDTSNKTKKAELKDLQNLLDSLPSEILILSSLYILAFTRNIDAEKKLRCEPRMLKKISLVGNAFCSNITKSLKTHFSNLIANSYNIYLNDLPPEMDINGAPISFWGSYVSDDYIRKDCRGHLYAPCIYSNQITLAHLIISKAKVAIVNEIIDSSGNFVHRLIYLFEGDGVNKLKLLSQEKDFSEEFLKEPVVIFGGYAHSGTSDIFEIKQHLNKWLDRFPSLMIACDLVYPQFPRVNDDPDFNSSPIIPKEKQLRDLFVAYANIEGVSSSTPTLYCPSHIYTLSLGHLQDAIKVNAESSLPSVHGLLTSIQHACPKMWGISESDFLSQ